MKSIWHFVLGSALTVLSFSFYGCGGDDNTIPEPTFEKSKLITGSSNKRWELTKEMLGNADITSKYRPCELDNFHVFYVPSTYYIDAGFEKCSPIPEPDVVRGSYTFNSDTTAMDIVFPDTSYTARIKSLTSSEMVWEIDGFDGLYTKTFKALD
ncbi:MAG: hypothetical protein KDC92_03750 [Bacteroidetes bacterium]|nr:hypothetical protein [Bacteroidota bacterium]